MTLFGGIFVILSFSLLKTPPNINNSPLPATMLKSDRERDTLCGTKVGELFQATERVVKTSLQSKVYIWKCESKCCFLTLFSKHLTHVINGTGTGPANSVLSSGFDCSPRQLLHMIWSLYVSIWSPILTDGWHHRSGACHNSFSTFISDQDQVEVFSNQASWNSCKESKCNTRCYHR